jgi:hypothetical protein
LRIFANAKALVGVNVKQAEEGDFPFVVSVSEIFSEHKTIHICAGTLISNRNVLTADHCIYDKYNNAIQIVVGSIDLRIGRKFSVFWWISYDNWAFQSNIRPYFTINDLSIIRVL